MCQFFYNLPDQVLNLLFYFVLQDVCALYPCEEGEICLRKGGATCFDANGCDPDDIRLCGKNLSECMLLALYLVTLT